MLIAATIIVAVAAMFLLVLAIAYLIVPSANGYAALGALCFPLPAIGILALEYLAFVRGVRGASLVLGIGSFWLTLLGSLSLMRGLLGLLGILRLDRDYATWIEVWMTLGMVAVCGLIAWAHLAWWRQLRRLKC